MKEGGGNLNQSFARAVATGGTDRRIEGTLTFQPKIKQTGSTGCKQQKLDRQSVVSPSQDIRGSTSQRSITLVLRRLDNADRQQST